MLSKLCERVFQTLGPGHSECVYQKALITELHESPDYREVEIEKHVPILYECNHTYTLGSCRIDILCYDVANKRRVLIELKVLTGPVSYTVHQQVAKYVRLLEATGVHVDEAYVVNFKQSNTEMGELEFLRTKIPGDPNESQNISQLREVSTVEPGGEGQE